MKSSEEFKSYYDVHLVPTLRQLEIRRRKIVLSFLIFIIIPAVAATAVLFFLRVEIPVFVVSVIIACIAGTGFFYLFNYKSIKAMKAYFKSEIIAKMIKFIDESLRYSPDSSISRSEYHESKLFLTGVDRYSGDDLVSGFINKTSIRFSELHTEYKTESTDSKGKKRTQWNTIFKGIFFIGDFNKHFKGETIVLPDTAESLFGSIGSIFQKMNVSREQLVKLEDPDFEKAFCVYSNDQVEARYILSTALMRRIIEFKKKSGRKIYLSFIRSKMFIATSIRKNLFEPPFFSSMLNYALMEEYFRYLSLTIGIVEELDLNTRIWTKT